MELPKEDNIVLLAKQRNFLASERTWLAAERTFSAWMRTGLAGLGGGVAIVHFLYFENPFDKMAANLMGELLILWAIVIFLYAFISFKRFCKRLEASTGHKIRRSSLGGMVFLALFMSVVFLLLNLYHIIPAYVLPK